MNRGFHRHACLLALASAACQPDLDSSIENAAHRYHVPTVLLASMAQLDSRSGVETFENGQHGWIKLTKWRGPRYVRRGAALLRLTPLPFADPSTLVLQDPVIGLEAAAALLRRLGPPDAAGADVPLDSWRPALLRFSSTPDPSAKALYADLVLKVAKHDTAPVRFAGMPRSAGEQGAPFVPYLPAGAATHRPLAAPPRRIKYIVIHTTQGAFSTILGAFRNPRTEAAAHYMIRAQDGFTLQLIDERVVAFHDACFNEESIGIEHEGYVAHGDRWYTDELYSASARLVRDIAARYHIPLDRQHIFGHGEAPDCSDHDDPGPHWDWSKYMRLVQAP